jgi:hypothetical protein
MPSSALRPPPCRPWSQPVVLVFHPQGCSFLSLVSRTDLTNLAVGHVVQPPLALAAGELYPAAAPLEHYTEHLVTEPKNPAAVFPSTRPATPRPSHSRSPVIVCGRPLLAFDAPHLATPDPPGSRVAGHASGHLGCSWAYSLLRGNHLSAYSRPAAI